MAVGVMGGMAIKNAYLLYIVIAKARCHHLTGGRTGHFIHFEGRWFWILDDTEVFLDFQKMSGIALTSDTCEGAHVTLVLQIRNHGEIHGRF